MVSIFWRLLHVWFRDGLTQLGSYFSVKNETANFTGRRHVLRMAYFKDPTGSAYQPGTIRGMIQVQFKKVLVDHWKEFWIEPESVASGNFSHSYFSNDHWVGGSTQLETGWSSDGFLYVLPEGIQKNLLDVEVHSYQKTTTAMVTFSRAFAVLGSLVIAAARSKSLGRSCFRKM